MGLKSDHIKDIISKISDLEFQRKVWLRAEYYDIVLNHTEALCQLEDRQFFDDVENNSIGFTSKDLNRLQSFLVRLNNYEPTSDQELFIDETWLSITKEAKQIRELLENYDW